MTKLRPYERGLRELASPLPPCKRQQESGEGPHQGELGELQAFLYRMEMCHH